MSFPGYQVSIARPAGVHNYRGASSLKVVSEQLAKARLYS